MTEYRSQQHEIEIAAPPEAVWAALTEPEEMKKWYVEDASVEPREGGAYRVSWGPEMEGTASIEVWDPPRRLRLIAQSDIGPVTPAALTTTEEYTLEVRGERTLLRMTFSNLPADESWDTFYEGTNLGWDAAFAMMRYCLERRPGLPVTKGRVLGTTDLAPPEAWTRVMELLGGEPAGRYETTTALGDRWSGEVIFHRPPSGSFGNCSMAMSVTELDGSLFTVGAEVHGGRTMVYAGLTMFGEPDETAAKAYRELLVDGLSLTALLI